MSTAKLGGLATIWGLYPPGPSVKPPLMVRVVGAIGSLRARLRARTTTVEQFTTFERYGMLPR